jgi:outer membrane protein assembly factor BamB
MWRFETRAVVFSSPAIADGTVYVGSLDSTVYAIDVSGGWQKWKFRTLDWGVNSSPAIVFNTV